MDNWAQLVCVTDTDTPPVEINKDKFTIGRARGNDLALCENKLVSGTHCFLERDSSGAVWLYDTSTNGTLLNMTEKLAKGECRQLRHGDEFFIVYKKNNEELNVGYMYQDLEELAKEDLSSDVEETQEMTQPNLDATLVDDELNLVVTPDKKKRPHPCEDAVEEPSLKRTKSDDHSCTDEIPGNKVEEKSDEEKKKDEKTKEECKTDKKEEKSEKKKAEVDESDAMAETLICIICQEILHDCISLQPCMHSFCSGCYSDWMERSNECPSCRLKVDRINKNHIVNNLVEAYLKEHPEKKRPDEDIADLNAKNKITRDMLYPTKKKRRCDSDDDEEDYTDSEEDASPPPVPSVPPTIYAAPMPGVGTVFGFGTPIFGAVRPPKTVCRQCPEYKDPTQPATGVIGGIKTAAIAALQNLISGIGGAGSGGDNPGTSGGDNLGTSGEDNPGPSGATATATGETAGPSTSGEGDKPASDLDEKVMPTPPDFKCIPTQNHMLCQCCLQPMPDRRHERVTNPAIPPQQCCICFRAYCHAYWGCRTDNCLGCIGRFRDMNFGKKCLVNLILDNTAESNIFKDYLEEKNISVKDVLKVAITKLEGGQYKCFDQGRYRIDGNTVFCYACGMRNFKDLAYQYRKDIPPDQLSAAVRKRPDCYWGKNCRTQRNKPEHAARYNHICEQTRTT